MSKSLTSLSLETVFSNMPDAVYLINPETSNIIWGNEQAWEMLGMEEEEILDHSVLSLQKDVHGLEQWKGIVETIAAAGCFRFLGRHLHKLGHEIEVEINSSYFSADSKNYILSIARDIRVRKHPKSQRDGEEQRAFSALLESSDGVWDWNIVDEKVFFSPQLSRLLGYGPDEMGDDLDKWKDNIHPNDAPRVFKILEEHLSGKRHRFEAEYRLRNRNGHYIWVQDRGKVCEHDDEGRAIRAIGLVHDITTQKQIEVELQNLASYDSLTGLLNRRKGKEYLESQIALPSDAKSSLYIAYIDIDSFKLINDLYGHSTGDSVLKLIADVLKSAIDDTNRICRWGGDEFILISSDITLENMKDLAGKLRRSVERKLLENDFDVTISVGISSVGSLDDAANVLSKADSALYLAKSKGKNRVEII
jgi:diguanylate cyclase (GGDEF)-like protein/PAS domain S-box-containing protein